MTFDRRAKAAQPIPTTLSGAAHASEVRTAARSRRSGILYAAAVILGGTSGTTLALRLEPTLPPVQTPSAGPAAPVSPGSQESSGAAPTQAATPPSPTVALPSTLDSPASTPSPDPRAVLADQIKEVLSRFLTWSHDHPGARCPDITALGAIAPDPWGHPLRLVCADQPADQMAAVVSVGPDGVAGNRDDIASWTMGSEVTDLVRGPRWGSTRRGSATAGRTATGSSPRGARPASMVDGAATSDSTPMRATAPSSVTRPAKPTASTGAGSNDTVGDGIPDRR